MAANGKKSAKPPFADLENKSWEKRFIAAKRLTGDPGKQEFALLAASSRRSVGRRLIALLDDPDSRVRREAATALGALGCHEAVDALVAGLADSSEWVRLQSGEALGKLGGEAIAPVVSSHLQQEGEPHVRATLVKVLGLIGNDQMTAVLALYLEDSDARVRANCVEALLRLNASKDTMRKQLLKLASDGNNRVLANAALGLVSLGDPRKGREILNRMLESADEYMRASAIYALGEIRDRNDLSALIRMLGDSSWLVRKNAVRSLGKFGKMATKPTSEAFRSSNPLVRLGAVEVLGILGDITLRQEVIRLLEDDSGEVRSKAEEVLDLLEAR